MNEKLRYDKYGLHIREGADRQTAVDIGAEFLAWATNHQDQSKHVGEVMLGPWFAWLARSEDD